MSNTVTLWTRRDPFVDFRRDFDGLVRSAFAPAQQARPTGFAPAAEIVRDGEDAVVAIELPGVDVAKDVTVEIDGSRLIIRGERRDTHADNRGGRSLREVRYGSFRRSFGLPKHVGADAVTAGYDAGVLTVRVAGAYAGSSVTQIPVTATAAVENVPTETTDTPQADAPQAEPTQAETGAEPTEA